MLSKISARPKRAILSIIVPTLLQHGHRDLAKRYLAQYKYQNDSPKNVKYGMKFIALTILTYSPAFMTRIAMSIYKIVHQLVHRATLRKLG